MNHRSVFVMIMVCLLACASPTQAQTGKTFSSYEWRLATPEKFDNPIFVTHAGDGSKRLFVAEQAGFIWIVSDGTWNSQPFLDISDLLPDEVFRGGYTERGLLGLAFHPRYTDNGQLFIYYTRRDRINVVARLTVSSDPDRADPASLRELLAFEHPEMNHNGGMLAFGPDGYLYISSGDGGIQGDPNNYAQDLTSYFGKLLRIDVNADPYKIPAGNPFINTPGARPEIWAYGLRNPWRFSFDRQTGDLYVADVGWARIEEVSFLPKGAPGGANFGWNYFEGQLSLPDRTAPADLVTVPPLVEYGREDGQCSITGGYAYRGPSAPTLKGVYIYGDYCIGRVWALWRDEAGQWQSTRLMETAMQIASFGEDETGGLYLVNYKGFIYRLRQTRS